ncbi:MAG: glycoside hydrolase family 78 protein, partial [Oscillospiraceae bacterium]|nr:glycoside hydrolase family 78 protein [Oscillospiraceae bacterium]
MLRTTFITDTSRQIVGAKLYITALGTYEMCINGRRMSEDYHNPGQSVYHKTLYYHTYDVTDTLVNGENAMGATLSQDFWSGYLGPSEYRVFGDTEALMCRLVIAYDEGPSQIIVTDPATWKTYGDGPVRIGSNFMGERYDASKEAAVAGWSETNYDDSLWEVPDVIPVSTRLPFEIVARRDKPVRLVETLAAQRVLKTHSLDGHTWTYDIGVNTVGVPSVTIPAGSLREGDEVIIMYGESVYPGNEDSANVMAPATAAYPNGYTYESLYGPEGAYRPGMAGRVLTEVYRAAMSTDFYIAGKYDENRDVTFAPRFTFHGFRFVQVTIPGRDAPLPLGNVKGLFQSSLDLDGAYHATTVSDTDALLNQFFYNTQRSNYGNYFSIPTDCPQRNERLGWTGDVQIFSRAAAYHGDIQSFMRNWMRAFRDEQGAKGEFQRTIPWVTIQDNPSTFNDYAICWSGAVCMVPWQVYSQYGDTQIIKENLPTMKKYLDYLNGYPVGGYPGLTTRVGSLADHLAVDSRTTTHMVANATLIYLLGATAQMAEAIGETDVAQELRVRSSQAKDSWNRLYINPNTGMTRAATLSAAAGTPGNPMDTQASYALPLNFDVVSDTMTVTDLQNVNYGMTYKDYAHRRLAQLAADPRQSGNNAATGATINSKPFTVTTGFVGTAHLLPALSRGGHWEEAYAMMACREYPSWLYPVTLGATSQWEKWNGYEQAFAWGGNGGMNSENHFATGAAVSWMYEYQLGIASGDTAGYQDFILQPMAGGDYTALKGSHTSNYGTIYSAWTADGAGHM